MRKLIAVFVAVFAVGAAPATSWGKMYKVTVVCPGGKAEVKEVNCTPGQFIFVEATCAGKKFTTEVECTAAEVQPRLFRLEVLAGGGGGAIGTRRGFGFGEANIRLVYSPSLRWDIIGEGGMGASSSFTGNSSYSQTPHTALGAGVWVGRTRLAMFGQYRVVRLSSWGQEGGAYQGKAAITVLLSGNREKGGWFAEVAGGVGAFRPWWGPDWATCSEGAVYFGRRL